MSRKKDDQAAAVISIAQLVADPNNPRGITEDAAEGLAFSLSEFGDIGGITFNQRTGELVTGHQRVAQLRAKYGNDLPVRYYKDGSENGFIATPDGNEFPVRIVDWPRDRQVAANLVANSPAIQGYFTDDVSDYIDIALDAMPDISASIDLNSLRIEIPENDEDEAKVIVEDDVPEPAAKPVTRVGDLWILGNHRLICGDSQNADVVRKLIDSMESERQVDAILTDPPYGVDYVGKTKDALPVHNDGKKDLLSLLQASLGLAFAECKPGGIWYVTAPAGPQFYDFATVLRDLEVWRQGLVWEKQTLVLGHSDFHYQHEAIFYGWKPGAAHQAPPDRKQTSRWSFDRPTASREHPTMKPVALFAHMLDMSTNKGDIIYDPFMGSGTTLIAAEQKGRICCGVELGPEYCDVIIARFEKLTGQEACLASTGETYAQRKKAEN